LKKHKTFYTLHLQGMLFMIDSFEEEWQ